MDLSIRAIAVSFSADHGVDTALFDALVVPLIVICVPAGDAASASVATRTKEEDRDNGVLLGVLPGAVQQGWPDCPVYPPGVGSTK